MTLKSGRTEAWMLPLPYKIQHLRTSVFIISKIRKIIYLAELKRAFKMITCLSQIALFNYGYYDLPITTIVLVLHWPIKKIAGPEIYEMQNRTRVPGWDRTGSSRLLPVGKLPGTAPLHRACENGLPWFLLSLFEGFFQSPNFLLEKWIIWDLKPKSLGCEYSLYCTSRKV